VVWIIDLKGIGLVGEIVSRFEKRGYKLSGIKMVKPSSQLLEEHYGDLKTKPFFPKLIAVSQLFLL
jgi:nucleoside-diphosphate kinase